jgi:DNA-binding MarR family transcriptional regulator
MSRTGSHSTRLDAADAPIMIALGSAQVNQIVRTVSGAGHLSLRLSKLTDTAQEAAKFDRSLSRSLVLGLLTYASFPDDGSYLGVAEIAKSLGMNTSTTHRYITTLLAVGLIERHSGTRRYRLSQ